MKTQSFRTGMKCAFVLASLALLTEQAETSSSKQTVIKVLAFGIDSLGIQSLKALVTQLGVTISRRPLNREKPSALAEGVFTELRFGVYLDTIMGFKYNLEQFQRGQQQAIQLTKLSI